MAIANEEQAEYWGNSASGVKWLTFEDQLDHLMTPVLKLVLDRADLELGTRVLDIGCGTGASSIEAATCVGPDGHVLGADISSSFLDRARSRAADAGLKNTEFQHADAQVFPFKAEDRDALISRFGVMFFADSIAAFSNMAKALKPGAQMTFAAWGSLYGNPWFRIPHIAAISRLGDMPKVDRYAPGPMAFHDIDHVTGILAKAGLTDIHADSVQLDLNGIGTELDSAALCMRVGPAARVISHFEGTAKDIAAIEASVARELAHFVTANGLKIPALINLYQARRGA
ncbi:MAG: class I SAM-dependent methyltransferase [Pseudomonadota bacterium]